MASLDALPCDALVHALGHARRHLGVRPLRSAANYSLAGMQRKMSVTVLDVPRQQRLASIQPEIHSKGHCYAAEDIRRDVLIVSQRMQAIKSYIEDCVGEPCSLASLFESATLKLQKGYTGSFRVHRLAPSEVPAFLDEKRPRFAKTVIAARNPDAWRLVDAA